MPGEPLEKNKLLRFLQDEDHAMQEYLSQARDKCQWVKEISEDLDPRFSRSITPDLAEWNPRVQQDLPTVPV